MRVAAGGSEAFRRCAARPPGGSMKRSLILSSFSLIFVMLGCSSGSGVDLDEPRRVLGSEADVRVDAQIFAERVGVGTGIRMTWEIENRRRDPIAVADLIPHVTYDETERTLVVN